MGTSYTPSIVANTTSIMDFKENSNSNNWISFINAVFASIAVLPVFLVWFLGIITDSIEEKENQDERVIIIDENDNEEVEESKGDTEERHLYVIPNLRNPTKKRPTWTLLNKGRMRRRRPVIQFVSIST